MHLLLPSDVFPPRCGGAGWSVHALALALLERGHRVQVVVPQQNAHGTSHETTLGVPTTRYGYHAPKIPFLRNYARHERLWPRLADLLVAEAGTNQHPPTNPGSPLIHAQHVQVAPAAVLAAQRLGAPCVVTVRDHWPWDYFATGLHGDRVPYQGQTQASLATDVLARLGPLRGLAALPAIPYMLAHLHRRQMFLRQADAVVAPSQYIKRRLSHIVAPERIHVIPNMVDLAAIERTTTEPPQSVGPDRPFLLFVGKLEHNKGAHLLLDIFRSYVKRSPHCPDLVIAGDGALQPLLERELTALGIQTHFLAWADHDEVLRLMARCTLLLFPSAWGEPLSRVLLEASACGAPILAMPTGGTPDVIIDGVTGALEPTPERFAARMLALLEQPEQRQKLRAGAQQIARERFSTHQVVQQVVRLYHLVQTNRTA